MALIIVLLPRAAGVTLAGVRGALDTLTARELFVLSLLWAAGLLVHSFVLTGALPGLSRRRALTLSLTGSAVANMLPFGGAAGMSLNYAMVRSWRLSAAAFAAFTVVTNAWDIALKLILPAAALAALLVTHAPVVDGLRTLVGSTVVVLGVLIALLGIAVSRDRAAAKMASICAGVITRGARLVGRRIDPQLLTERFLDARQRVSGLVAERWAQLSVGMIGYATLQATLLWSCVAAVGDHLSPTQVIVGYAVDRVLTLAVLTPGAAGVTEAGTAAALVAVGGSPTSVAAGVLLYRAFTFAIEIPVGGVWLGGWMWLRRRTEGAVA
jgi:putative heme transporter